MLCEHENTAPCVECDIEPLKAENEALQTLMVELVEALAEALEQVIKAAPSSGPLWHGSEQIVEARAALTALRKEGEPKSITDEGILAIAGRIESCPVSPWWLKDDVVNGDVQAAVLRFARALLDAVSQPEEQPASSHDWDDQDKCRRCGDRDWYASATCTPSTAEDVSHDSQ